MLTDEQRQAKFEEHVKQARKTTTVGELIEKLSAFPKETEVYVVTAVFGFHGHAPIIDAINVDKGKRLEDNFHSAKINTLGEPESNAIGIL